MIKDSEKSEEKLSDDQFVQEYQSVLTVKPNTPFKVTSKYYLETPRVSRCSISNMFLSPSAYKTYKKHLTPCMLCFSNISRNKVKAGIKRIGLTIKH